MRFSVSIMAHPERTDQVMGLLRTLHLNQADVPVAWDREGPPRRDHDRVWRNCSQAWSLHDPLAEWHLVLQDDAVLCPDFLTLLDRALLHVPERAVLSGYLGLPRPLPLMWEKLTQRAKRDSASWIVGPRAMWGVALAMPTRMIPGMLAYGNRRTGIPDDQRIGGWARKEGLEVWYPWPSPVEHGPGESLIGYTLQRRAYRHMTRAEAEAWDPKGPVARYGKA